MIKCGKCGKENKEASKFCIGCGAELPKERTRLNRLSNRFIIFGIVALSLAAVGGYFYFKGFFRYESSHRELQDENGVHFVLEVFGGGRHVEESGLQMANKVKDCGIDNAGIYKLGDNRIIVQIPASMVDRDKFTEQLLWGTSLCIIEKREIFGPIGFNLKNGGALIGITLKDPSSIFILKKNPPAKGIARPIIQKLGTNPGEGNFLVWYEYTKKLGTEEKQIENKIVDIGGVVQRVEFVGPNVKRK